MVATKSSWLSAFRRKLEFRKLKSRRHRAADQGPVAIALGGLPGVRRNDGLRCFAGRDIRAERHAASCTTISNLQRQRRARLIVPDLYRIDAMPVRALAAGQQEIDRGRS